MKTKSVDTKADYKAALKEIESPMGACPNTPKGERLNVLANLVEAYKRQYYPPTPD